MLVSLSLALAMSTTPGLQDPARPPAPPPVRTESRVVFVTADPDGENGLDQDVRVFTVEVPEMSWTSAPEGAPRITVRRVGGEGMEVGAQSFVFVSEDGEVTTEGEGPVRVFIRHGDGSAMTGHPRIEWIREGEGAEMDANGDGLVTEAEFLAPMRDVFRQMDADGSGVLEEGERGGNGVRVVTRTIEVRQED